MPEFKQIIGRGTRLRPDYGKLAFNIIDYTGTATEKFADPDFDGEPVHEREETIDDVGEVVDETDTAQDGGYEQQFLGRHIKEPSGEPSRKYYVDEDTSRSSAIWCTTWTPTGRSSPSGN